jgi:hypothetical protein
MAKAKNKIARKPKIDKQWSLKVTFEVDHYWVVAIDDMTNEYICGVEEWRDGVVYRERNVAARLQDAGYGLQEMKFDPFGRWLGGGNVDAFIPR